MQSDFKTLPYPGLRAFKRDESLLFFGRESCVDSMIERLARGRFLAVLGASGSGKSSLVRTGLFEGLELGFYARAGARWTIIETRPGGAPMANLAFALAGAKSAEPNPQPAAMVQALLERGPRGLIEWAQGGVLKPSENILICIDQFEELFRYGDYAAREEAEAFVAVLLESARSPDVPIHIVVTMRSEYLGACALMPGLAEQMNAGFYLTPRMTRDECRRAIEGPAAILGFEIEPSLVNQILNDMASFAPWEEETSAARGQIMSRRADQLPLMQHLLNQLWLLANMNRQSDHLCLTLQDYTDVGGLSGALDQHGGNIMASLAHEDRAFVPMAFRTLVSGQDATNAVRRPCKLSELQTEGEERKAGGRAAVLRVIEAFRANGCNFIQPPPEYPLNSDTLIDISHESLIRQWSSLTEWVSDEARSEANWRRLLVGAERHASGVGELLSGLDLASLEQWWEAEYPTKAWAERNGSNYDLAASFLKASRSARDEADMQRTVQTKRERRRLIATLAAVSIALVFALGAIFVGLKSGFNLKVAEDKLMAAQVNLDKAITASSYADKATAAARNDLAQTQRETDALIREQAKLKTERDQLNQQQVRLKQAMEIQLNRTREAEESEKITRSIIGASQNLTNLARYCRGHRNEPACQILLLDRDDQLRSGTP
jgi:hypothetical protein